MRAVMNRGPGTRQREEGPKSTILPELDAWEGAADEYSCPVCGIELTRSNFDTPERDYYCPFCSTRQTPSVVPSGRNATANRAREDKDLRP
jgi:rubredoxin